MATQDIMQEREGDSTDPAKEQAERLAALSAERQSRITLPDTTGATESSAQAGRGTYAQQSEARSNSIALPDTTPITTQEREARIAARPDFNAPFTTDQRGNRTAVPTVTGEDGQVSLARTSAEVRGILSRGGPRNAAEEKRMGQFSNSTAGKAFDFGGFQASIAKVRRGVLGQKELERQVDSFIKDTPKQAATLTTPAVTPAAPRGVKLPDTGTTDTSSVDVTDSIEGGLENVVDSATADDMVANLDTTASSIFSQPTFS
jgi:hypothetical protein